MMGQFNGIFFTTRGQQLQAKAQAGATLRFTRIAMGDGELGSQQIINLTALISEKKSLPVTKLAALSGGKATVGASYSNSDITTGFYFRELGVFAEDPDLGEILYCYGNAGANADYIPPGGSGSDIIEQAVNVITIVGNAANVTADINESLVFVTRADYEADMDVINAPNWVSTSRIASKAVTTAKIADKAVGSGQLVDGAATDTVIGTRSIDDTVTAAAGADTPTRLWSKLANVLKFLMGTANWYTLPSMTISAIITALTTKAPLASPSLTGTPTTPTAALGTNNTQIASAAFVHAAIANSGYAKVLSGSYTGNDAANRDIALPFTPVAVLVLEQQSSSGFYSGAGGLAVTGSPSKAQSGANSVVVGTNKFTVSRVVSQVDSNISGKVYNYIALG